MSGRSPRWISVQTGPKVGTLPVESIVKLNLSGTPWDWLVVHQGLPSDMYDESCNGTWLLLKDCYESREWTNSSNNILENSTIHSYLNGDFLNLFDDNVKSTIKQVKIPYRSGGGSGGSEQSGANGLPTKVFLLSMVETGHPADGVDRSGAKLDYFPTGDVEDSKRKAYLMGAVANWWLRSQNIRSTGNAIYINTSGGFSALGTGTLRGIRPAIILPSSFRISEDLITYPTA